MDKTDLKVGTVLRQLRGKHVGGDVVITQINSRAIHYKPTKNNRSNWKERKMTHQWLIDWVVRNCEIVK